MPSVSGFGSGLGLEFGLGPPDRPSNLTTDLPLLDSPTSSGATSTANAGSASVPSASSRRCRCSRCRRRASIRSRACPASTASMAEPNVSRRSRRSRDWTHPVEDCDAGGDGLLAGVVDMADVRGTRISLDFSPGLSHGLCLAFVLAFSWASTASTCCPESSVASCRAAASGGCGPSPYVWHLLGYRRSGSRQEHGPGMCGSTCQKGKVLPASRQCPGEPTSRPTPCRACGHARLMQRRAEHATEGRCRCLDASGRSRRPPSRDDATAHRGERPTVRRRREAPAPAPPRSPSNRRRARPARMGRRRSPS